MWFGCFVYSINELTHIPSCVDIEVECLLILAFVFVLGIIIQNTKEKFFQLFVSGWDTVLAHFHGSKFKKQLLRRKKKKRNRKAGKEHSIPKRRTLLKEKSPIV